MDTFITPSKRLTTRSLKKTNVKGGIPESATFESAEMLPPKTAKSMSWYNVGNLPSVFKSFAILVLYNNFTA